MSMSRRKFLKWLSWTPMIPTGLAMGRAVPLWTKKLRDKIDQEGQEIGATWCTTEPMLGPWSNKGQPLTATQVCRMLEDIHETLDRNAAWPSDRHLTFRVPRRIYDVIKSDPSMVTRIAAS